MLCLSIANSTSLCNLVTAFGGDKDDDVALRHGGPLQLHILTYCVVGQDRIHYTCQKSPMCQVLFVGILHTDCIQFGCYVVSCS